MEASTRNRLRPAAKLVRKVLLPPLLAGIAVLCLLLAVAISFGQRAKANNPLAGPTPDELAHQLTADIEGTPTAADIQRAQKPLSERKRLLAAHPYFALYKIAKHRFGVSWYLVAAVHYQDTGFGKAPTRMARDQAWQQHRYAINGILRPTRYPNRSERHPSVKDDFDVVMAIAADLKAGGASQSLGPDALRALAARYGSGPDGRLASAMIIERARAWRLLGTLPLPGSGELATPVKGVIGGCGYFGCPRPGHLHNGVDFLAPTGTPIHAADDGEVASVQSPAESGGYGNFVCIQHRPHLASCYAHMSAFAKGLKPGERVKRGQVIGLVGSTGSSTASHLHFEVRRGPADCSTCAVDPLPLLSGEVPNSALPEMADEAPASTSARAASAAPIAAAPAAPVAAPVAPVPARASAPTPGRTHGSTTGGAVPKDPAQTYTTPAPAPAQAPAPQPQPPVPQPPAPPATEPTTGGAVAPPQPPPPEQPAPQQPPA